MSKIKNNLILNNNILLILCCSLFLISFETTAQQKSKLVSKKVQKTKLIKHKTIKAQKVETPNVPVVVNSSEENQLPKIVWNVIDQKPEFEGGIKAFFKFIGDNYKTPNDFVGNGRVFMSFIVETDGSLNEIKILRDVGFGTGQEAVRVLKLSPKWKPGLSKGIPVRCNYQLPISISVPY